MYAVDMALEVPESIFPLYTSWWWFVPGQLFRFACVNWMGRRERLKGKWIQIKTQNWNQIQADEWDCVFIFCLFYIEDREIKQRYFCYLGFRKSILLPMLTKFLIMRNHTKKVERSFVWGCFFSECSLNSITL